MKLIECPRDAMQGLRNFIPTEEKVKYLQTLLAVGFDTLDAGSFVSPKAIPQMRDTAEVLRRLDFSATKSKILVIVANTRGATEAAAFEAVDFLGFPLSLSETFQQRNTNKSIADAFFSLEEIQTICSKSNKRLVVYLSMGFGNPYGDPYAADYVQAFVQKLQTLDVGVISLADTIGVATNELILEIFPPLLAAYPEIAFGMHLHATPESGSERIKAALTAGCERMDGALLGIGGCPMAKDDLVGNLATEQIVKILDSNRTSDLLNWAAWDEAVAEAQKLFATYH